VRKARRRRVTLSSAAIALAWFCTTTFAAAEPPDDAAVAASIEALAKQAQSASDLSAHLSDERGWLDRFYAPAQYAPAWTHDGHPDPILAVALDELRAAPDRGLDPSDYDVDRLTSEAARTDADGDGEHLARFDVAVTTALLRYMSDLNLGRVRVDETDTALAERLKRFDAVELLRAGLIGNQLPQMIAGVESDFPFYARLKSLLPRYRELAGRALPELPPPSGKARKVAPGDRYAGTLGLRERLWAFGDLTDPTLGPPKRYAEPLVSAVKAFQARHGLDPDGVLGTATLAALNVPPARRLRQIELSLERLRWLPSVPHGRYLAVNVPAFRLMVFDGAEPPAFAMRVIAGKAEDTPTPAFVGELKYIEFNPYWNVPPSIATGEILPKLARHPGYLAANDMEIVSATHAGSGPIRAEAAALAAVASGRLRIRQRPGPKNPLGPIKFALPNTENIYLHSTPSPNLFQRARRDFSHGCIRVEDPVVLAQFLLRDQPDWTRDAIEEAMAPGGKNRFVKLTTPVPVAIFYSTVMVGESGEALFLPDVYGWDDDLESALAARGDRLASR
jgi:murein L,D-transpeptidase YcbB/YkuD